MTWPWEIAGNGVEWVVEFWDFWADSRDGKKS